MGKRLRSLASVLWDSDTEQPQNYFGVENNQHGQQRELQLENDSLKSQVHDLTCEVEDLKKRLATMSQLQNDMVPPFTLETMSGTDEWVCKLRKDVVCLPDFMWKYYQSLPIVGFARGALSLTSRTPKRMPAKSLDTVKESFPSCPANTLQCSKLESQPIQSEGGYTQLMDTVGTTENVGKE